MSDALHAHLRSVQKPVHRLGLACNYGIDAAGVAHAIERGINYFFWSSFRTGAITPTLAAALRHDRERFVIATGPTLGFFGGGVRSGCEAALRALGTDYLDVYQLYWLGITSAETEGTIDTLRKLKEEGKIRSIGCSIHDRPRAGRLAEDSAFDLLMLRYNAAHPGAEREVFPHVERRGVDVVAYTATNWRRLLTAPKGWTGATMTAGDCYRFCLADPHVKLVLTGPASRAELDANLDAVEQGPLDPEALAWMRAYGKLVHG